MDTGQLYYKLGSQLKYFIVQRVGDSAAAEDILHDVFIKIHNSINSLKDTSRLESWVFQITRNTIIDFYRQKKQHIEIDEDLVPYDAEDEEDGTHKRASSGLFSMVEELPEIYRDAILLTEYQGLTQKELASRMNISLTGAKSRVQRARKMLRDMLLQCCHFEYDKYGTVIDYSKICCCCSSQKNKNILRP
ncbi:MAG: RNA polymerase sigma factor SigZ [Syntrophomonadaceae bacterium]